jgi:hypothetical protein
VYLKLAMISTGGKKPRSLTQKTFNRAPCQKRSADDSAKLIGQIAAVGRVAGAGRELGGGGDDVGGALGTWLRGSFQRQLTKSLQALALLIECSFLTLLVFVMTMLE